MKYMKAFKAAFFQQLSEKGQLVGRLLLFAIIVFLFQQVFTVISASADRICYVAITEAIIISTAPLVLTITSDIRSNQAIYFLIKPVDYCTFRTVEALGNAAFRYLLLFSLALILAYAYHIHPNLASFFLGFLGVILYTLISLVIGLCSFWMRDIKTLLYFNLTATFCFGGLLIPLSDYPLWMQKICYLTPYPWILYWPASLFCQNGLITAWAPALWALWCVLFLGLSRLLFNAYRKRIVMEGG